MTTLGIEWDTTALICDTKNSFKEKFPILKTSYYSITTESWNHNTARKNQVNDCFWSLEVNLGPFNAKKHVWEQYYSNFHSDWTNIITTKNLLIDGIENPIVTYSKINIEKPPEKYYSDCCKTQKGYYTTKSNITGQDIHKAYIDYLNTIRGTPQITLGFKLHSEKIAEKTSFMKRKIYETLPKNDLVKFLNKIENNYERLKADPNYKQTKFLKGGDKIINLLLNSWIFAKNQLNISELGKIILFLIIYNINVRIFFSSINTSGYLKAFFLLKPRTNIGTIIHLLSENEKTQIKHLCKDLDFLKYFISEDFSNINFEEIDVINITEYLTSIFSENEHEKPIGYVLVGPIPENIIIDVPSISHKEGFNKNIFNFSRSTLDTFDKLGIKYEQITYSYDTTFGAKIPELILKNNHLKYKKGAEEVLNWDIGEWAYDPNNPQIIVECRAPLTIVQLYFEEKKLDWLETWKKPNPSGLLHIDDLQDFINIFIDFIS
jgi:hypothetical protein